MLNANYLAAAKAVKTIDSKGKGLWNALLAFTKDFYHLAPDALKDAFKQQEDAANNQLKVQMGKNSTYKVAKGKLLKAHTLGISLVDAKGKAKGKTAIEEEIKAIEGGKASASEPSEPEVTLTPSQQFAELVMAAERLIPSIPQADTPVCAGMVSGLYKQIADRLPQPMAA